MTSSLVIPVDHEVLDIAPGSVGGSGRYLCMRFAFYKPTNECITTSRGSDSFSFYLFSMGAFFRDSRGKLNLIQLRCLG